MFTFLLTAVLLSPGDVVAGPPTDVSVTVYRTPQAGDAGRGPLDLDRLAGFALISETRTVSLPAGVSRIRFEGVADGIETASALISGLPEGVLEKNRDAQVLSPSALVTATVGRSVVLVRTNPKTGERTEVPGKLDSDADGVVFEAAEGGLEALRCSGLPETLQFEPVSDLNATPTLSALVRSPKAFTARVKLSYLARGFDWQATYTAVLAPDGKTLDLGAWVTLANSNVTSFMDARAQVVAGRVNRKTGQVEPIAPSRQILARCWPRGSTSDTPEQPHITRAEPLWGGPLHTAIALEYAMDKPVPRAPPPPMMAMRSAVAQLVKEEQLGDLKLYRVPERTSVNSRQIKQVRLLERGGIPVEVLYGAALQPGVNTESTPTRRFARTQNDRTHHLGLPLPSGRVASLVENEQTSVLLDETSVRDTTLEQKIEFELGQAADVRVAAIVENRQRGAVPNEPALPVLPGISLQRSAPLRAVNRIELTNARDRPVVAEITLNLDDEQRLVKATVVPGNRDGHPLFVVTVPANGSTAISYQTEEIRTRVVQP